MEEDGEGRGHREDGARDEKRVFDALEECWLILSRGAGVKTHSEAAGYGTSKLVPCYKAFRKKQRTPDAVGVWGFLLEGAPLRNELIR